MTDLARVQKDIEDPRVVGAQAMANQAAALANAVIQAASSPPAAALGITIKETTTTGETTARVAEATHGAEGDDKESSEAGVFIRETPKA